MDAIPFQPLLAAATGPDFSFLSGRALAWWVIYLSIFEFVFIASAFRIGRIEAGFATIAANALSGLLGVFLLPPIGSLAATALAGAGIAGTAWWLPFALAVPFNVATELPVYRYLYKLRIDRRALLLVTLANIVSIFIGWLTLAYISSLAEG